MITTLAMTTGGEPPLTPPRPLRPVLPAALVAEAQLRYTQDEIYRLLEHYPYLRDALGPAERTVYLGGTSAGRVKRISPEPSDIKRAIRQADVDRALKWLRRHHKLYWEPLVGIYCDPWPDTKAGIDPDYERTRRIEITAEKQGTTPKEIRHRVSLGVRGMACYLVGEVFDPHPAWNVEGRFWRGMEGE